MSFNYIRLTDKERVHGIYAIYCDPVDTTYIGKHLDCWNRWEQHKKMLREGKHYNKDLQADWDKYGEKAFSFRIIKIIDAWDYLGKNNLLVELACWEWHYIFDVYYATGKKLYNDTNLRERGLWYIVKNRRLHDSEIKLIRDDIEGIKGAGSTKLDIFFDDPEGRKYCISSFDLSNDKNIKTYSKHKKYCEERNINFTNLDPRAVFGLIEPEPGYHTFSVIIDNATLSNLTSTVG